MTDTLKGDSEEIHSIPKEITDKDREYVEQLLFENKHINALIKGLEHDIEVLKKGNEGKGSPSDVVRFTIELNIFRDKRARNLASINEIIKARKM